MVQLLNDCRKKMMATGHLKWQSPTKDKATATLPSPRTYQFTPLVLSKHPQFTLQSLSKQYCHWRTIQHTWPLATSHMQWYTFHKQRLIHDCSHKGWCNGRSCPHQQQLLQQGALIHRRFIAFDIQNTCWIKSLIAKMKANNIVTDVQSKFK